MTMGFIVFVAGLLADLISQNRQLNEITLEKIREMELVNVENGVSVNEFPIERED